MSEETRNALIPQLIVVTLARLLMNTTRRLVYPFAPELGRGLAVPVTSIYSLITLRNFVGVLSPLFGPLSERYGRKPVLIAAVLFFSSGCLLIALWPQYWALGGTLALVAIAKVVYDPALQAFVGDRVPYGARGRVVSFIELAWAGSFFLGIPLVGIVMRLQGWRAPFVWLGGLGLLATVLIWRWLIEAPVQHTPILYQRGGLALAVLRQHRVVWAAAGYALLVMAANELFFIVYGSWMEAHFALSLTNLGLATGVIGGAEVCGEMFTGWATDRFGKRPVIITTGLLAALFYGLMPLTGGSLLLALVGLFTLFFLFEATVVGAIPLQTEIVPTARGTVMSIVIAASALGRMFGSLLGPWVTTPDSLLRNGLIAAVMTTAALLILAKWVREAEETAQARRP